MAPRGLGGPSIRRASIATCAKERGLVSSVGSALEAGQTRTLYAVEYASDPANVSSVRAIVVRELKELQTIPVGVEAPLLREIPLNEPTRAGRRYVALGAAELKAAFAKYLRPDDLALLSQGPAPQ